MLFTLQYVHNSYDYERVWASFSCCVVSAYFGLNNKKQLWDYVIIVEAYNGVVWFISLGISRPLVGPSSQFINL